MTNEQIRLLSKMKKLINEGKRRFANRKDLVIILLPF